MDSERNKLINLLFPAGIPVYWEYNINFNDYISKIGTFKVEDLVKEPNRLKDEKTSILEQRQELAGSNYKTFIQTAECSKGLFHQFNNIESKLNILLENIPQFEVECQIFANETSEINKLRRLNSLTLTRNAKLLEILELPQLMDSFIKDGLYEEALELAAYVRKLFNKHPDIPIFQSIVADVKKAWLQMLHQLLGQLRQELSLSKCLQMVGHLRRMEVFTEPELRLKFLQTRDTWLHNSLNSIPKDDGNANLLDLDIEKLRNRFICEDHFDDSAFMNVTLRNHLTPLAIPRSSTDAPSTSNGFPINLPETGTGGSPRKRKLLGKESPASPELKVRTPTKVYKKKSLQMSWSPEVTRVEITPDKKNEEFINTFMQQGITPIRSKRKLTFDDQDTPRKKKLKLQIEGQKRQLKNKTSQIGYLHKEENENL